MIAHCSPFSNRQDVEGFLLLFMIGDRPKYEDRFAQLDTWAVADGCIYIYDGKFHIEPGLDNLERIVDADGYGDEFHQGIVSPMNHAENSQYFLNGEDFLE